MCMLRPDVTRYTHMKKQPETKQERDLFYAIRIRVLIDNYIRQHQQYVHYYYI
jgi:lysyl-tRNA synthetase class I